MSNELQNIGFAPKDESRAGALAEVAESRAVAEVQAAYVIAKKFPRDEHAAYTKIMKACERPLLASQATYTYSRGGSNNVSGPSIRLAEALAQSWGNVDCGIREVSQENGVSIAEAFAIDLETNMRISKTFHVKHVRDTKSGSYALKNSRDVYEIVANQGARRLRACILGIIPGDVVDAAVARCKKTEESIDSEIPLIDRVRKMVLAFDGIGIKAEHLEKRLGHKLDLIVPAELVSLQGIYRSIKDGIEDRSAFFDIATDSARSQLTDVLKVKKEHKIESSTSSEVRGDAAPS